MNTNSIIIVRTRTIDQALILGHQLFNNKPAENTKTHHDQPTKITPS
jgi:hypothetical protein